MEGAAEVRVSSPDETASDVDCSDDEEDAANKNSSGKECQAKHGSILETGEVFGVDNILHGHRMEANLVAKTRTVVSRASIVKDPTDYSP